MNFMIVEDEEDVCLAMADRLRDIREGAPDEIFCAFSPADAMKIIEKRRVDCLITDIRLPGESGLTLIERAVKLQSDMQSIVVTAYDDFSYAQRALRLGCVDFLLKPFTRQAFKEAIGRAFASAGEAQAGEAKAFQVDWVKAYVKAHLGENLNMSLITDKLYMSYAYFSRRFKEETGQNFSDYLLEARMNEARRLLLSGSSVGYAAEKVGYANIYGFTRAFTRVFGLSPTRWLKAHTNERRTDET